MSQIALVISIASFLVALVAARAALRALGRDLEGVSHPFDDTELLEALGHTRKEIESLRAGHTLITEVVDNALLETKRRESRIRSTVSRARRELAEHGLESPGLEAEYGELQVIDGEESPAQAVPDVPVVLEPRWQRIPGLPGEWPVGG